MEVVAALLADFYPAFVAKDKICLSPRESKQPEVWQLSFRRLQVARNAHIPLYLSFAQRKQS
jgi:hypothetical protein